MPTRPKPVSVLRNEKRSHRTKAELEHREKAENALLTGESMVEKPEVKADDAAHAVFLRARYLLRKIGKSDALYENIINRYAQLAAECRDFERKRETFHKRSLALDQKFENQGAETPEEELIRPTEYFKLSAQLQAQVLGLDKQVQAKRKMLLDIEKECVMTISAALRAIPKQEQEEDDNDPMAEFLASRPHVV